MTDEGQPSAPSPTDPPRLLRWASLLVCAVVALLVPLGAWQVGVWGDEPAHVVRYDNLQERGWYLLNDDFDGDEPGEWVTDRYVYAPVATQVMHGVNRVLGLDPAGSLGTSIHAYGVRHLVVGLLGLLGVLAVAATGRRLLGSWSWGLVSAATLLAIPMWPGLSMFDIKDVPAATGYTLVTLGLVELLTARRPPDSRPRSSSPGSSLASSLRSSRGAVGALTAGLVLAVGVRPGLWPGLAVSIVLALAAGLGLAGARSATGRRTWLLGFVVPVLVAGVVAYAVLLASYPTFFSRPHEWLPGAIGDSSHYTGSPTGDMDNSRTYLPARVVATMPSLLMVVGAAGLLTAVTKWSAVARPVRIGWLLVAAQALLLPTLAVVRASALYDDLRQLLFAAPAVALLLTLGWHRVASDVGTGKPALWKGMAVLWSVALLVPTAVQLQLFPYGYSYVSPLADKIAVEKDWARMSLRALLPDVPAGLVVICNPKLSDENRAMRYAPPTGRPPAELSGDCRTDPMAMLHAYRLADAGDPELRFVQDTFVGIFARGKRPGVNCEVLGEVSRTRYVNRVVLSKVARCDLVLNPYPDGGVVLAPDGTGTTFLLGGWTSNKSLPGVQLRDPFGALGVKLPQTLVGEALAIRIQGQSPGVPEVLVNNEPVDVRASGDEWLVDVPASTVDSFGDRRLVLTLVRPGDEPLTLTGVVLDAVGDAS